MLILHRHNDDRVFIDVGEHRLEMFAVVEKKDANGVFQKCNDDDFRIRLGFEGPRLFEILRENAIKTSR